jgi:hypothetical protein
MEDIIMANELFNDLPIMPGRTELDERKRKLSKYLKRKIWEMTLAQGEPIKQKSFADKLGFSSPVFNSYVVGSRMPEYDGQIRLAALFGEEIFDICGSPRPMPTDPGLRIVVDAWKQLSLEDRKQLEDLSKKLADQSNPALSLS